MRTFTGLLALIAVLVIGISPVAAANPHLVRADAHFDTATRNLTIDWKIAGLGNGQAATVTVSGDYTITFACTKNGRASVGQGVPFQSPRSGEVGHDVSVANEYGNATGSFTVNLAPPVCPMGWTVVGPSVEFHFDRMSAAHSTGTDIMAITWY